MFFLIKTAICAFLPAMDYKPRYCGEEGSSAHLVERKCRLNQIKRKTPAGGI